LVTVVARVKDPKDVENVKSELIKAFDLYKTAAPAKDKLDAVKSNLKYSFALSLDSSEAIASNLAPYISLRRTPETLNKLYELYASITPQDIQSMAKKYFVETKRTTVILAHKEKQNASQ
jgi:zinc protease